METQFELGLENARFWGKIMREHRSDKGKPSAPPLAKPHKWTAMPNAEEHNLNTSPSKPASLVMPGNVITRLGIYWARSKGLSLNIDLTIENVLPLRCNCRFRTRSFLLILSI